MLRLVRSFFLVYTGGMKLIVGLGNHGKTYAGNRHNIGWWVVDELHDSYGFGAWQKKFKGEACKHKIGGEDVVLLKPHTYMNLSGESVQAAMAFYKLTPADVLAIHDDLDLKPLALRHKIGGSDAGHNGLKSITQCLGTGNYARLRIGIGRPAHKNQVSDYVLHDFDASEALQFKELAVKLAEHGGKMLADPHALLALFKPVG